MFICMYIAGILIQPKSFLVLSYNFDIKVSQILEFFYQNVVDNFLNSSGVIFILLRISIHPVMTDPNPWYTVYVLCVCKCDLFLIIEDFSRFQCILLTIGLNKKFGLSNNKKSGYGNMIFFFWIVR